MSTNNNNNIIDKQPIHQNENNNNNLNNNNDDMNNMNNMYNMYEIKNLCVECGVDMGYCNPRQYCGKTYCITNKFNT
jgi:hypothetical protein